MMESHQHLIDKSSQGEANSWLPISSNSSTPVLPISSLVSESSSAVAGDVDPAFCSEVVEMMSLVHFLIDKNPRSSFTRSGHMIYTKTPSKGPHVKMMDDRKGRNGSIPINSKKHKDQCHLNIGTGSVEGCSDRLSVCTPFDLTAEEDGELNSLKDHIEDLKIKLAEKDELLKQFETEKNHTVSIQSKLDEMTQLVEQKDSLIKTVQSQLANAQMGAADKQASFERMQWEWKSSNSKVEKLEEELGCAHAQISSINTIFQHLSSETASSTTYNDVENNYAAAADSFSPIDEWDESNVEEAMGTYMSAVTDLKQNQDDDHSVAHALTARLYLHSLIFPSKS